MIVAFMEYISDLQNIKIWIAIFALILSFISLLTSVLLGRKNRKHAETLFRQSKYPVIDFDIGVSYRDKNIALIIKSLTSSKDSRVKDIVFRMMFNVKGNSFFSMKNKVFRTKFKRYNGQLCPDSKICLELDENEYDIVTGLGLLEETKESGSEKKFKCNKKPFIPFYYYYFVRLRLSFYNLFGGFVQ